jgi:hypothetical protein
MSATTNVVITEARLRRLQWAVRLTLALGVAASVTANVLHAQPNPISQAIAAWPPVALLITVELVSRIPIYRRWLGVVRIGATFAIAGIAAWVSWHHMAAVVARYGETGAVPYLLPLSVDGLIVVASVSLVELAGRKRDTTPNLASPKAHTALALTPITPAAMPAESSMDPEARPIGERIEDTHAEADPGREGCEDHFDSDTDAELDESAELAADLMPLLPVARTARDELVDEGQTVTRDALAQRMRHNGHSIRNNRVSELLAALRQEALSMNGHRPTTTM